MPTTTMGARFSMLREIEIHHHGQDQFQVVPVEVTCGTDLMNQAYALLRECRADFVTFGPAFERYEDGTPAYGRKSK
jgi:hypothetical protein